MWPTEAPARSNPSPLQAIWSGTPSHGERRDGARTRADRRSADLACRSGVIPSGACASILGRGGGSWPAWVAPVVRLVYAVSPWNPACAAAIGSSRTSRAPRAARGAETSAPPCACATSAAIARPRPRAPRPRRGRRAARATGAGSPGPLSQTSIRALAVAHRAVHHVDRPPAVLDPVGDQIADRVGMAQPVTPHDRLLPLLVRRPRRSRRRRRAGLPRLDGLGHERAPDRPRSNRGQPPARRRPCPPDRPKRARPGQARCRSRAAAAAMVARRGRREPSGPGGPRPVGRGARDTRARRPPSAGERPARHHQRGGKPGGHPSRHRHRGAHHDPPESSSR